MANVDQLRDAAIKRMAKSVPRIEGWSMERESFSAAFAGWQKQAIPMLEQSGKRLSRWPIEGMTWKQICGAVAKTYRRGQRRLAKTITNPDPENFHSWRQRMKDLWYQLRILQPLNRLVLEKLPATRKRWANFLAAAGVFLLTRLERERSDDALRDELEQLEKLARKRTAKLNLDALELGRRFYAEPVKAFAKRISIFIGKKKRR